MLIIFKAFIVAILLEMPSEGGGKGTSGDLWENHLWLQNLKGMEKKSL